jgi:hypothetical protein
MVLDPSFGSTWGLRRRGRFKLRKNAYFAYNGNSRPTWHSGKRDYALRLTQYWREGRAGAVKMGVRHGLYCLGCCWALFAVLTAVGMMSIAWMLSLTLVVFAEKVLPYGVRISAAVGAALIVIGLLVASGALQLPWRA